MNSFIRMHLYHFISEKTGELLWKIRASEMRHAVASFIKKFPDIDDYIVRRGS